MQELPNIRSYDEYLELVGTAPTGWRLLAEAEFYHHLGCGLKYGEFPRLMKDDAKPDQEAEEPKQAAPALENPLDTPEYLVALRDQFAAHALAGILANRGWASPANLASLNAFAFADAMMQARITTLDKSTTTE